MPNGVRNSAFTLFFLCGMAFMAVLIFMIRPDLLSRAPIRETSRSTVLLGGSGNPESAASEYSTPSVADERAPASEPEASARDAEQQPNQAPSSTVAVKEQNQSDEPASQNVASSPLQAVSARSSAFPPAEIQVINAVQPGRRVLGHVTLIGELPRPKSLQLRDGFCGPNSRGTNILSRVYLRAEDNSLADVLIEVSSREIDQRKWPASKEPAVVANQKCQFEPYTSAIQAGQKITFKNLDAILHNVHSRPVDSRNQSFNLAQFPHGRPIVAKFDAPEKFIRVECDIHPYMVAYVSVMPTPFFSITKADGRFEIPNLPPGEYTVIASHRKLGSIERKVTVTEHESAEVNFVFGPPEIETADRRVD